MLSIQAHVKQRIIIVITWRLLMYEVVGGEEQWACSAIAVYSCSPDLYLVNADCCHCIDSMARVHSLCLCRTAVLLVCCASAQVIASSSSRAALVASNEGFHVHHVMAERHLVQQQQQPEEETDATAAAALAEDVYGSITIVRSAGELLAAVSAGAEHIEIQEHMSLAVLLVNPSFLIRPYPSTIKSIRVSCYLICLPAPLAR